MGGSIFQGGEGVDPGGHYLHMAGSDVSHL